MNVAVKKPLTVSPDEIMFQIETVSGNLVNPTNPNPDAIDLHDIAWSLSRIPRFAGHTVTAIPYNVAQHSIYVSQLLERFVDNPESILDYGSEEQYGTLVSVAHAWKSLGTDDYLLIGLLHDAHEAYIGDIPSPIKRIPELRPTIKLIEGKLDHAIRLHFKLDEISEQDQAFIKFCDLLAQAIEGYQFMPSRGLNWELPKPSLAMLQQFPEPLSPLESYTEFIKRFEYLSNRL